MGIKKLYKRFRINEIEHYMLIIDVMLNIREDRSVYVYSGVIWSVMKSWLEHVFQEFNKKFIIDSVRLIVWILTMHSYINEPVDVCMFVLLVSFSQACGLWHNLSWKQEKRHHGGKYFAMYDP